MSKELLGSFEVNRVYQRDCIEGMKAMPDDSVDLILTDIPYGEVNRKSNGLRNLDKKDADIITFDLDEFIDECTRICRGNMYIFCGTEQVSHIRARFVEKKLTTRHCVWEKSNPSPMNGQHMWLSSIENCIYAKKKGSVHNEHCKSGVWKNPVGRGKQHPTEKPLKLFERLVEASSNEGMIVFDPCLGSGTTVVAAKNLNRKYIGFEINPEYIKLCNLRLEADFNENVDEKILDL